MSSTIEYLEQVKKDLKGISRPDKDKIRRAIEDKLMTNPLGFEKPLQYSLEGLRRLRVSDYRVVFQINQSNQIMLIVMIGHRKEVYGG